MDIWYHYQYSTIKELNIKMRIMRSNNSVSKQENKNENPITRKREKIVFVTVMMMTTARVCDGNIDDKEFETDKDHTLQKREKERTNSVNRDIKGKGL